MSSHIPVLLKETIDGLKINKQSVVVDATIGGGGHSKEVIKLLGQEGLLIGIDQDSESLVRAKKQLSNAKCEVKLVKGNFRNIDTILDELGVKKVNHILFDLGWNMDQFEDNSRGFSYKLDGPLKMTLDDSSPEDSLSAEEILNNWKEESLIDIFKGYGEERYSKRIAKAIVEARKVEPIKTTFQLVEIIKNSTPKRYLHGRIHFATRIFQALRITVNDELGALKEALEKGFSRLAPCGRMAVISFHSLEDRIVKNFFNDRKKEDTGKVLTKKPITATQNELLKNKRARSAKLRIIEKKYDKFNTKTNQGEKQLEC